MYSIARNGELPGAELLEIRHQASHSKVVEAPLMLFAFLSVHPTGACIKNIYAFKGQNHQFNNIELDNIRECMGIYWNNL